ncbi:MAG: hypothetical protein M3O36_02145 [Myxococcota bacterium]|nr:hypothetical protein [Myxococcota bacterium]
MKSGRASTVAGGRPADARWRVVPLVSLVSLVSLGGSKSAAAEDTSARPRGEWVNVVGTSFVGDGLRLNNPYRLATVLGSDARSVSRTAAYADVGAAFLLGEPERLAHGLALRASFAVEGVSQSVVTPAYLIFHRWSALAAYARAGVAVALMPDTTWGFEGGAGGVWFARAGIGLALELVADVFYGAGTREVATPAYPVLSAQGGLWLSWEAMP